MNIVRHIHRQQEELAIFGYHNKQNGLKKASFFPNEQYNQINKYLDTRRGVRINHILSELIIESSELSFVIVQR